MALTINGLVKFTAAINTCLPEAMSAAVEEPESIDRRSRVPHS